MRLLVLFASIIIALLPGAQGNEIDDYVLKAMREQGVPAISMAVVKNGKITMAKGYGLANVELNVPATEKTVYQWASITKQFTGAAIQILAAERKLKVDDLLRDYYTTAPPAWSNVTLRHLLTHTSGIKSYTSIPGFSKNPRQDYHGEEIISLVRELPLEFKPGDRQNYSNTGYYLLGYVIEKVSGQSYGEFLASRIFRPLKMETALFNDRARLVPNRASGYTRDRATLQNAEFVSPSQPFAAGGLAGTVLDLAKWDTALDGDDLLPRASRDEMWKPVKLNNGETFPYGFGWFFGTHRDRPYIAHGGGIPGFSTYIAKFTKEKLTVVVLMNSSGDAQKIANHLADLELAR